MISQVVQAKHLLDLNEIKGFFSDVKIKSAIIKAGELNLLNTLIVYIGENDNGEIIQFTCNFIPMDEEFVEHNSLLQFYYVLPFQVDSENKEELNKFLIECNLLQPIGNFGIKNEREIFLRYVAIQNKYEPLDKQNILEISMLFEYAIEIYEDFIDKVNNGDINSGEAIKMIVED